MIFIKETLVLVLILVCFYIWKFGKFLLVCQKIPGPFSIPLLGNLRLFYKTEGLSVLSYLINTYGRHVRFWILDEFFYVTNDPKDLKIILSSQDCLNKSDLIYNAGKTLVGDGILISKTEIWKRERRLINLGFTKSLLDSYFSTICDKTENLVHKLKSDFGPNPRNIYHFLSSFVCDVFCTNFLQYAHEDYIDQFQFGSKLMKHNHLVMTRLCEPWLYTDFVYSYTARGKETHKISSDIWSFIDKIKDDRRNYYEKNGFGQDKKKNLIEILLDPKSGFSESQIRNNLVTMMIAAVDSSSFTLSFAALILGGFPHIQQKLHDEIMCIVGRTRRLTPNDLPNLKYTERFISEMLRLFPSLPAIARRTVKDIKLEHCTLPKGSNVVIGIYHLHRNENLWPNPLEFDPDRFLPENSAGRDTYSYIPFSMGQRNCIGMRYASIVLKVALVDLVRNFEFHSDYDSVEKIKVTLNIIINKVGEFDCCIKMRS